MWEFMFFRALHRIFLIFAIRIFFGGRGGGGAKERGFLALGDRRKGLQLFQQNFLKKGPNVAIL
jgi:hypothetical protein